MGFGRAGRSGHQSGQSAISGTRRTVYNSDMAKLCPNCRTPMQEATFRGVVYDVCPKCSGLWFDQGELGKVRAATVDSLAVLETAHRMSSDAQVNHSVIKACPNDLETLTNYRYSTDPNVELDHCPVCGGIWVEEAELGKMDQAFRRRIDRTPPPDGATQEIGIMQAESEGLVDHEQRLSNAWKFMGQHHLWPGL